MNKFLYIITIIFSIALYQPFAQAGESQSRFFYSGNGKISLRSAHTKAAFNGIYRNSDGTYRDSALKQINRVFGAGSNLPQETVSLRLIEFLDYLKDKLGGKTITIVSGYRSPDYNTLLRNNGALAGKASLHQYGMAADFYMANVPSKKIWEYVRDLGFGGTGYYHGKNVHVDVGPARWWDEATSKVGTDLADDNKLIMITTDRDIYLAGETINLSFARMTAWPIGLVREFKLEKTNPPSPPLKKGDKGGFACDIYTDTSSMQNFRWPIPKDQPTGRYRIRTRFCEKRCEAMPDEIATDEFVVHSDVNSR